MRLTNVELHQALIETLPIADEKVDAVISNGVIDLVPDKDAVFGEIDRVLRPGGRLQVARPASTAPWDRRSGQRSRSADAAQERPPHPRALAQHSFSR